MSFRETLFVDYEVFMSGRRHGTWHGVICLWLRRLAFRVVVDYRLGHWCRTHGLGILGAWFDHRNWKRGVDICSVARIGKGLRLAHPHGIVIGGKAEIGEYVHVLQGVTIGGNTGKTRHEGNNVRSMPRIGSYVLIGAGAKILGPVDIGDDVIVGANAVVVQDIPASNVAVGIPARNRPMRPEQSRRRFGGAKSDEEDQ